MHRLCRMESLRASLYILSVSIAEYVTIGKTTDGDFHEIVKIQYRLVDVRTAWPGLQTLMEYLRVTCTGSRLHILAYLERHWSKSQHLQVPQGDKYILPHHCRPRCTLSCNRFACRQPWNDLEQCACNAQDEIPICTNLHVIIPLSSKP